MGYRTGYAKRYSIKKVFLSILMALGLILASCTAQRQLAQRYYNIASDYYTEKNYRRAVSYYELALAQDPNLKVLYLNYGLALLEVQNYAEAERQLLRSYALDQHNTLSLSALGYLSFRVQKYRAAAEWYRKSVEINKYNPETFYNIGVVEQYMKNYAASQQAFNKMVEIQPPNEWPVEFRRFAALNALRLGKEEQAIKQYGEYLDLNGQNEQIFQNVYDFYTEKEQYERIVELFASFEGSLSGKALPAFLLARLYYLELDDPALGETNLKTAIDRGFNDQERLDGLIKQLRGDVRKVVQGLIKEQDDE